MTPESPGQRDSVVRQAVEVAVRTGLQVVDTTAALAESGGRVSGVPALERLGEVQGRLLRRSGEAWASAWRSVLR
jgi:hypothetical protein